MKNPKCPICKGPTDKKWKTMTIGIVMLAVYEIHCRDLECGMTYLPIDQEEIITKEFKAQRKNR